MFLMSDLVAVIHVYRRTDGGFNVFREDHHGRLVSGIADEDTTKQIKEWLDE